MNKTVAIRLPYPVSSNDVWARTKNGIRKSSEYTAWLQEAGYALNRQKIGTISGKYRMTIQAVRPDNRRRDIDNIIGSISDCLQANGVIQNDYLCQFVSAEWVERCFGLPSGVLVQLSEAA